MPTHSPRAAQDAASGQPRVAYKTPLGAMLIGKVEDALTAPPLTVLRGKVNLVFTSPPFPLVYKKRYGNESGDKYVSWLEELAPSLADLLAPDGSIVVELGNAWVKGAPTMSTLPLEALLSFKRAAKLHLCQHVICHNPARLPSPAAWVNVRRIRLKDSYTHVWWMSRSEFPKADNRKVLMPYSEDMKALLKSRKYNAGKRPSGHVISQTGFLADHGGSISPNVLDLSLETARLPNSLLKFTGTAWDSSYRQYCADHGLELHPARMPMDLAAFFIQFLTNIGDLVLDPFAGSNTTGAAAELLGRRWFAVEAKEVYAEGSKGRFQQAPLGFSNML
jgi:DNA modification methylase